MITCTDEIEFALSDARERWPDLSDTQLLHRLIAAGHHALRSDPEQRRAQIATGSGALTGTYEAGYLQALHAEWPA